MVRWCWALGLFPAAWGGWPPSREPPSKSPVSVNITRTRLVPSPRALRERIQALRDTPAVSEAIVLPSQGMTTAEVLGRWGSKEARKSWERDRGGKPSMDQLLGARIARSSSGLSLVPYDISWLDLGALGRELSVAAADGTLEPGSWRRAAGQFWTHFSRDTERVTREVQAYSLARPGRPIPVSLLLPPAARHALGRFSSLRGRNCFNTALSFHDAGVDLLSHINVASSPNHHRTLVNHDAFAWALWMGYYELSAEMISKGLQFGDVVVLANDQDFPSFTSLKHAAVHIASGLYYHKANKFASSPISLTTWEGLTGAWSRTLPHLGIHVYRRLHGPPLHALSSQKLLENIAWGD